jgi:FMN phosphatase YigB (HAD superfamily)
LSAINSIVFDIGQVLFAYDPARLMNAIVPDSAHHALYREILFDAPIWQAMDRGNVSHSKAKETLASQFDFDARMTAEISLLLDRFSTHLELIEGTRDIFLRLEKQFPLYLLSNFQDEPFDRLLRANPFLGLAKGMVVSAKINMMKPEPEIYAHLLETYNLDPAKTLFIDDLAPNIAEAKKAGIQGIVFESPEKLKTDLLNFGIKV